VKPKAEASIWEFIGFIIAFLILPGMAWGLIVSLIDYSVWGYCRNVPEVISFVAVFIVGLAICLLMPKSKRRSS
jgi:hypothetical protein